jgi:predicted short-subunit dehydrogenase-like oxidoreductase (DUF2520 family)
MAQQDIPEDVVANHLADHADVERRHAADHAEMSRRNELVRQERRHMRDDRQLRDS